jgi:hypothetical protein
MINSIIIYVLSYDEHDDGQHGEDVSQAFQFFAFLELKLQSNHHQRF